MNEERAVCDAMRGRMWRLAVTGQIQLPTTVLRAGGNAEAACAVGKRIAIQIMQFGVVGGSLGRPEPLNVSC